MKNQLTELGLYINPYRINKSFDDNGVNMGLADARDNIEKRILLLRKDGLKKPEKNFVCPEKEDNEKYTQISLAYAFITKLAGAVGNTDEGKVKRILASVSNERFKSLGYGTVKPEEVASVLERARFDYKKYLQYFNDREAYERDLKKYESHTSDKYVRASLAFKLSRKLEKLLALMLAQKEKPEDGRAKAIQAIFTELQGGIAKPSFNKGAEREYVMKFSDLYTIPQDEVGITNLLNVVRTEFKDNLELFGEKNSIKQKSLKFSSAINAVVSYVVQEVINDLLELGLKNMKGNKKNSLLIENYGLDVLSQSAFWPLIFNLPCVGVFNAYMKRVENYKVEVEETKRMMKEMAKQKKKSKCIKISSFYDSEKAEGKMKLNDKKKKVWEGLNAVKEDEQFCSIVVKVFEKIKEPKKLKIKLSSRVKEFLAVIVSQMLHVLVDRFKIHSNNKRKIEPFIGRAGKERQEEKTIKFETVIEIFDIVLCPKTEASGKFIDKIREFKKKLKN